MTRALSIAPGANGDMATTESLPSCSIAMATYNGAAYLREQLQSFRAQTVPPGELVVCDDASTDESVGIVESFARDAPFAVRLERNRRNLGSTKSFEKAMSLCRGDVIFLSDQDDAWSAEKIETMLAVFGDPGVASCFSNGRVVGADGHGLGYDLWSAVRFDNQQRRLMERGECFRALLRHNCVTGAALAFRRRHLAAAMPIPVEWVHDAWLALVFATLGRLVAVDRPLLRYRLHGANQVGVRSQSLPSRIDALRQRRLIPTDLIAEASRYRQAQDHLGSRLSAEQRSRLAGKIEHFETRGRLPARRLGRVSAIAQEILAGHYRDYSYGWGSAVSDLVCRASAAKPDRCSGVD